MQIYRYLRARNKSAAAALEQPEPADDAPVGKRTDAAVLLIPAFRRRRLVDKLALVNSGADVLLTGDSDEDAAQVAAIAQASQRRILSSSSALLLSLGLAPFLPLANVAALGLLLYAAQYPFRRAITGLQRGSPNGYLLTSASFLLLIMTGNLPVAATIQLLANTSILTTARAKGETSTRIVHMFKQHPRMVRVLAATNATNATSAISANNATSATNATNTIEVPFSALRPGDTVLVVTGEMIPADGQVVAGSALVDQQALTGEAQLVSVGVGDTVFAMTNVSSGELQIAVEHAGDETVVAQIGDILNRSLATKARAELWIEDVVNHSIMPTLAISAFLLPTWGLGAATAFMVAHPKMKGAILVSVSALNYFYMFSDQRILVKDARALDYLQQVDTIVFDKTGTLTTTELQVIGVHTSGDYAQADVLRLAASAEQNQQHPIADAICTAANALNLATFAVTQVHYAVGMGLAVQIDGQQVHVGSARFMQAADIHSATLDAASSHHDHDTQAAQGNSLVFVAVAGVVIGSIELQATLRPEAADVLGALSALGIQETIILSGDRESSTRQLAEALGVHTYYAEALPQDKAAIIDALIAEGRTVCYVGDGINDAIALSKAQVSVSLSGASHAAMDTARIVLMDGNLQQLPFLLRMGRHYRQNTYQILGIVMGTGGAAMALALLPVGLAAAVLANAVGFIGGLGIALRPLRHYRQQQQRHALPQPTLPHDTG